jgi:hypothetical protein
VHFIRVFGDFAFSKIKLATSAVLFVLIPAPRLKIKKILKDYKKKQRRPPAKLNDVAAASQGTGTRSDMFTSRSAVRRL